MRRTVAAVVVAAAVSASGCSTEVLHALDERAANDAVTVLERAGVGARKVADDGAGAGVAAAGGGQLYAVRVAAGDGVQALDLLRAAGLPREPRRGLAETYGQPSLIPTPEEERARYLTALAAEIERTLESADGVIAARVHLVAAEGEEEAAWGAVEAPGTGTGRAGARAAGVGASGAGATRAGATDQANENGRKTARAAVLLKVRPGKPPLAEADVQKLVAGAAPGLETAGVAVVMTAAEVAGPEAAGPEARGGGISLVSVGPLRVAAGSRGTLLAMIAGALAVLAALAGLLFVTARRLAGTTGAKRVERATAAGSSSSSEAT